MLFLSPIVLTTKERDITMLRKIIFVLAASSIALTATACKTVRGAGQDIESAANAGSEATH